MRVEPIFDTVEEATAFQQLTEYVKQLDNNYDSYTLVKALLGATAAYSIDSMAKSQLGMIVDEDLKTIVDEFDRIIKQVDFNTKGAVGLTNMLPN